jgi:zinc transport system ATP-binding protein
LNAPRRAGPLDPEPSAGQAAIEIQGVSFAYGEVPVLERVDLSVQRGEFLGLVGPNAGGKSTLLKIILGLLEPQQGRVRVLGAAPGEVGQRIGYVPQHPSFPRDFPISVEQVALMGTLGGGGSSALRPWRYRRAEREAARAALAEVQALDLARRQIGSLSGGQLQRVLLARALAGEPEILILDEPTANIDQRLEGEVFDLLAVLNARMTILVVSHDVAFVSGYLSRVACLNRTLFCHGTDAVDGDLIHTLYGDNVRAVAHRH